MSDQESNLQEMDRLKNAARDIFAAVGERVASSATGRISGVTERLTKVADTGEVTQPSGDQDSDDEGGSQVKGGMISGVGDAISEGTSPMLGAVKGAASGLKDKLTPGKGKGKASPKATKAMNIFEFYDVGLPIRVAYNQWTSYDQFPSFMKKVEAAGPMQDESVETTWKAQVFWSHREWKAKTIEQVPDERIVWRSTGVKGHVDGAVSFHELSPTMTRIILILEYYPQGFMERTGNIWRAAGRRARLEFKHFCRHAMTRTILNPDEIEGWRGTIHDGKIVETHEDAVKREREESEESTDQADPQVTEQADDEAMKEDESETSDEQPSEESETDQHDNESRNEDREMEEAR